MMRLIYKFTLVYFIVSAIIFLIGINISIKLFISEVNDEVDYGLRSDLKYLSSAIHNGADYTVLNSVNRRIHLDTLLHKEIKARFSDTIAYSKSQGDKFKQRKLFAVKKINGNYYRFTLFNSLVEPRDAYAQSIKSLGLVYLLLIFVIGVISFFVSRWLLVPFYQTLHLAHNFDVTDNPKPLHFKKSTTREFNKLNSLLEKITSKIVHDYTSLKEFTENMSHEIQTPIAVANGKLEILADSKNVKQEDAKLIDEISRSLSKISNIQKALTLLSKIDNNEFHEIKTIDISHLFVKILEEFHEIIELKRITLTHKIKDSVTIDISEELIRIMLTNLIKNAVYHNHENGFINVHLYHKGFTLSNYGRKLKLPPKDLFKRFEKQNRNSSSLGLGLSIVHKICELHHFKIRYTESDGTHTIKVTF